jgi:hypothetical protein
MRRDRVRLLLHPGLKCNVLCSEQLKGKAMTVLVVVVVVVH